jgi:hypothetical protein
MFTFFLCWFAGAIEKPLVGHEISHHYFPFKPHETVGVGNFLGDGSK